MNIGFTIGKFAPFHKGHEFLINTALKDMDKFYVVVYDTPYLNIDMKTKIKWINQNIQNIELLPAYDPPKRYGLDEESVKIQMEYLLKIIKDIPVTHFYSSEEYGKYVSQYLNIQNVIVDKDRNEYNISARSIRTNVEQYRDFLNNNVYKTLTEYKILH